MDRKMVVRVPRLPALTQLGVEVAGPGLELAVEPVEVTLELGLPPRVAVRCRVMRGGAGAAKGEG
jgi:hypothetical protein